MKTPRAQLHQFWLTDRALVVLPFLLCLLLFSEHTLSGLGPVGRPIIDVVYSLVLLSGVAAVAERRSTLIVMGGVAFVVLVVIVMDRVLGGDAIQSWRAFASFTYCLILAAVVALRVFRDGTVDVARISGAVALYLLIGFAFGFVYQSVHLRLPGSFAFAGTEPGREAQSPMIYFSFVTLTTVGYGDITPVHPLVRSFANLEALLGQLFPAILLSRLVALEVQRRG